MKTRNHDSLDSFIRHAERNGTECVFETAIGTLPILALGQLSLRLQHLDPRWRLQRTINWPAGDFAALLVEQGVSVRKAAEMAQVSEKTVRTHQQAGSYVGKALASTL